MGGGTDAAAAVVAAVAAVAVVAAAVAVVAAAAAAVAAVAAVAVGLFVCLAALGEGSEKFVLQVGVHFFRVDAFGLSGGERAASIGFHSDL